MNCEWVCGLLLECVPSNIHKLCINNDDTLKHSIFSNSPQGFHQWKQWKHEMVAAMKLIIFHIFNINKAIRWHRINLIIHCREILIQRIYRFVADILVILMVSIWPHFLKQYFIFSKLK